MAFVIPKPDFDAETHVYRVDGAPQPSVTHIIKAAGLSDAAATASGWTIDEQILENAAERGRFSDIAIELDAAGELDDESVDDEIYGYVSAWQEFVADSGYVSIGNQISFYEPEFSYCGTLDDIGYIGDELTIIDRKTGSVGLRPWHKYQLAAYARPYSEQGKKWPNRMIVHLRPDLKRTRYRTYHFSPQSATWDWQVFQAARLIETALVLDRRS
jgi:hypothetical protein